MDDVIPTTNAESAKAQRRERRIRRRRQEILRVAKKAFLTKPYSEVTVEEIADAADVSKATIYLYFNSKAHIYGGVLEEDMQRLADSFECAYDRRQDTETSLRRFGREYVGYFREHPEYFTTLSFFFFPGREAPLPADIASGIEARLELAMGVVERCIRDATERGEIQNCDAWDTAVALWSMWLGATYIALSDRSRKFNSSLEHMVDLGVRTFLHGMKAPAPSSPIAPTSRR